jgi:hypothetical protein
MTTRNLLVRLCGLSLMAAAPLAAAEPPVIPVGLDAYRRWDHWADQRVGVRAYLRSTYDRAGGNERADASHFLYQLDDDRNVTLHVEGAGVLYFARYNHWHGSPWHYEVDGTDHIVQETSTADPKHPAAGSVFLPADLFPPPLTWTWTQTHGSDLMWLPVPFEHSFRMMYGRTCYGTGYYIYQQFAGSAPLSQPLRAWDAATPPASDVLKLLKRSGPELLPSPDSPEARQAGLETRSGRTDLAAGATAEVVEYTGAARLLRLLQFSAPLSEAVDFGGLRLRVTWDGAAAPSIDAPVALFFGAGTLHRRDDREYLVKAFPMQIRYAEGRVHLSCVFPMPFAQSARIELVNPSGHALGDIVWTTRATPLAEPIEQMGYFHATYRDYPQPLAGEDLVLLDTAATEGGGDWSGHFVGNSWIFSHAGGLNTLEGDPRFFFDDSQTPQGQGTGTEEWGGGGDYWGGLNMTLPFAGHPCGVRKAADAGNPADLVESAYRFLLADLMPFGKRAVIRLEHGGENQSTEHYEAVTYWYGRNRATLQLTDSLQIGDAGSETAHDYVSPAASAPYAIESRYEWGPDTVNGRVIFPAHADRGRTTAGTSEFTVKLDPANLGVLLRRKLDYAFPNQRAEMSIARVTAGRAGPFVPAGIWFLAGSNTCIFSTPADELGAPWHELRVSNRRFRDDEFLIQRALTAGCGEIRVRVRFTPVAIPLFPGHPLPELAWSEIRYDAYSILAPQ